MRLDFASEEPSELELNLASGLVEDPREGDETEVTERGGDVGETKGQLATASLQDPRPDGTEPIEEGDRPRSFSGPFEGDPTEPIPFG
jgi:hypothetical protein